VLNCKRALNQAIETAANLAALRRPELFAAYFISTSPLSSPAFAGGEQPHLGDRQFASLVSVTAMPR